jgi:protein gp37
MKKHKIGWLNVPGYIPQTWNPIVGCSKISEGCRNCYAERMACRLANMATRERPNSYPQVVNYASPDGEGGFEGDACDRWNGKTLLIEDALKKPLGWKKPRAIFVESMGDLFHENTTDGWIDAVFQVMAQCPQHLFIILTKRACRMERYIKEWRGREPQVNLWLGVTAENQSAADERIPHLLRTPAAVRFVSCEPLIGPVEIYSPAFHADRCHSPQCAYPYVCRSITGQGLNWIICGGESGPGARPMSREWARSLRDQAQAARVPFFFKQWGRFHGGYRELPNTHSAILDGMKHHQWPEVKK